MSIRSFAARPGPAAKAICSRCRRPVVVLKSGRCSYCGAEAGEPAAGAVAAPRIPPEVLIALEPRPKGASKGAVWTRRALSLGALGILVALFTGTCMKTS